MLIYLYFGFDGSSLLAKKNKLIEQLLLIIYDVRKRIIPFRSLYYIDWFNIV